MGHGRGPAWASGWSYIKLVTFLIPKVKVSHLHAVGFILLCSVTLALSLALCVSLLSDMNWSPEQDTLGTQAGLDGLL